MRKQLFWILFLFSCQSKTDTNTHLKNIVRPDSARTFTGNKKVDSLKRTSNIFDNHHEFEIISFANSLNKNTTDSDTSKCTGWVLNKDNLSKIIKNSQAIDGTTWDLSFLVLTCTKSLSVKQNGQYYSIVINAGSFFSVKNGDTTMLFGDYKKSDRKYFLEGPSAE